jgi:hypothetical protein
MWSHVPEGFYAAPIRAMRDRVESAKVTGVFVSDEKRYGTPKTGTWKHFAVYPTKHLIHTSRKDSPYQVMAERLEDFKNMRRALGEFSLDVVGMAVSLLESETLYRTEKVIGPMAWLRDVIIGQSSTKNRAIKDNLLWRAIASAPAGYTHPRTCMAGSLLEDISAGLPLDDVKKKFAAKMNPLQYQRPQAAPAAGAIVQAEKLVEKLGIAPSLKRRFATRNELLTIWSPPALKEAENPSVFGHLKPKGADALKTMQSNTAATITFDKFKRTALPGAETVHLLLPPNGNFGAFVSAVDMEAPPIIQWDSFERRNPVTWYVYHGGTSPARWNLPRAGTWARVTCVTLQPNQWQEGFDHHGEGVMFVLDGAVDTLKAGVSLFPEFLKSELHSARPVIEAYSKNQPMEGHDEASACGLLIQKNSAAKHQPTRVRVTKQGVSLDYLIDRWD